MRFHGVFAHRYLNYQIRSFDSIGVAYKEGV